MSRVLKLNGNTIKSKNILKKLIKINFNHFYIPNKTIKLEKIIFILIAKLIINFKLLLL